MKGIACVIVWLAAAAAAENCSVFETDAQFLIVLGSQLIAGAKPGEVVPGWSGTARATGGAVARSQTTGRVPLLFSGGYLCGVRYDCTGDQLLHNNSIAANAMARAHFPSEASTFMSWMLDPEQGLVQHFGPLERTDVLLEETSAGTDENAEISGYVEGRRLALYTFETPFACMGVTTSLYHMPRAMSYFRNDSKPNQALPVYAEDWTALVPPSVSGFDWIASTRDYYSTPKAGIQFNATLIADIMTKRRNGDLSVSVAEALPPSIRSWLH